MQRQESQGEF